MSNKIGILNFQFSRHNYGAVLQAAALANTLSKEGYEVEHIDLIPSNEMHIKTSYTFKNKLKRFRRSLKRKLTGKKPLSKLEIPINPNVFEEFRTKWIKRSDTVFHSINDLNSISNNYSAVIVGSDQVWRPYYTGKLTDAYFLSFVDKSCKKISYAASFGVDMWEEKTTEETAHLKSLVSQFNAVSVREKSGISICNETFDIDAEHVLDPTLLAGEPFFSSIIEDDPSQFENSVVYYKLDCTDQFRGGVQKIADKLNCNVENIYYKNDATLKYPFVKFNSVSEWLTKIKGCKLIITDSFHGTCLSILFNKQFIYVPTKNRGLTRLESLFEKLNIQDRICYNIDDLCDFNTTNTIDYSIVNELLKKERVNSREFLFNSLN